MSTFDRRLFLHTSLGGLATGALATPLSAQTPAAPAVVSTVYEIPRGGASPDTLFLTWQRDPTTTMTVQWVAPSVGEAKLQLHYALLATKDEPDVDWRIVDVADHVYPLTELRVFRVELTGLTPGAEYQFHLGDAKVVHRFRTMPARATDSFQFISGGDCGVNTHVVNNNILAAKQDPMFALIGGDIAYDDGYKVKENLGFLRNYSRYMIDSQKRLIPLVVCLGNHEVRGGYAKPRSAAPFFFALFDGLYADRSYATLDFGDYLSLILLDTGHISSIDGEQTDWLRQTLAERERCPHVIVANHVPAYPSYRKSEADGSKAGTGELNRIHWVPLFERYNVDVVLEHHDHTFKRTHPLLNGHIDANGLMYLGDGSWGKLRAPKGPELRPYLAKVGDAYQLTLHRLEGDQRFHLALAENGRVVDICRSQKRAQRKSS